MDDDVPVDELPADTALEEPAASVAGQYAVVLSAGRVAAHDARQSRRVPLQLPVVGRGRGDGLLLQQVAVRFAEVLLMLMVVVVVIRSHRYVLIGQVQRRVHGCWMLVKWMTNCGQWWRWWW